ncbi:diacylglycerol kinase family protein [Actinopolymorpha sp. B17G11]|uniref:diacylglycerol/lipid kinase family protein n=1 Tax=Actinopolymorpha sp. B17G11 TaxID=3160861 RepID=UPI0032E49A62
MESLLVVIPPDADGVDEHKVQAAIDTLRAEADVQAVRVRLPGELDGALHRRGGRTVVVAGGDRHLHSVVAALHRRNELDDALLAVLPDGSGRGFACGAGVPPDPDVAAKTVLAGVERRFDLLVDCRGSVVVNAVHLGRCPARGTPGWWGLGGGRDGFGDHGPLSAFGRPARRRGSVRPRALHVRIEADDEVVADFDRPVWSVAVTNGRSAMSSASSPRPGAGSTVASCAVRADGHAELVVGFAVDPVSAARHWLRRPHPIVRTDIQTVRAREIKVCGQRFWMTCDGQDSGTEQRCTWKVVPQSLRMVVPAA